MFFYKKIKLPREIKLFVDSFTNSIKNKDLTSLKEHFSEKCKFHYDYTKFKQGVHEQSYEETIEATQKQLNKLQKIENKVVAYTEKDKIYYVNLLCKDYLDAKVSEVSYMEYEEELTIQKIDKMFRIINLSCIFKQLK